MHGVPFPVLPGMLMVNTNSFKCEIETGKNGVGRRQEREKERTREMDQESRRGSVGEEENTLGSESDHCDRENT